MARIWRLSLAVAVLVLAADQTGKFLLIGWLAPLQAPVAVAPFFNLVMVWNRGISFGMLQGAGLGPWPLVALSGAIVVALLVWLRKVETRLLAVGIGALVGGAIGNATDRIVYGAVADFFDFYLAGYHWPAFNIADSAIVIGVLVILWDAIVNRPTPDASSTPGNG